MPTTATEWIACIIVYAITAIIVFAIPIAIIAVFIYATKYFKSEQFLIIKQSISDYIADCNALNEHIEDLRATYASMRKTDYGEAEYQNLSRYNYKKKKLAGARNQPNIYDCSRQVCDNARKQPFKYICKYFNIKTDEATLAEFETVLNNFIAAEDGKVLSKQKHNDIIKSIDKDIPVIIKTFFRARLDRELGFEPFQFSSVYFPTYSFRYISSGGNSGTKFDVTFDIPMLERFIGYMGDTVKFRKSAEGQRRLMTPKLRASIIERDRYTCQICGNSTMQEPNLLLEVDHIIPIAKGGMTTEDNLQCLCWKCNRSKGAKTA